MATGIAMNIRKTSSHKSVLVRLESVAFSVSFKSQHYMRGICPHLRLGCGRGRSLVGLFDSPLCPPSPIFRPWLGKRRQPLSFYRGSAPSIAQSCYAASIRPKAANLR